MDSRFIFIGRARRRVESTGSTNADLARMALEDPALPDGFVLLADEQTAGKGRQGRSWSSPPGSGLTFSVLLKPGVQLDCHTYLGINTRIESYTTASIRENMTMNYDTMIGGPDHEQ